MAPEARRWIFLRGLGRHSHHWGEFVSSFKRRFPLWSVELLDLAGNGTEAERESFLRIESYMTDVRSRSKSAQMGPVSILSISMGAMVAADWADKFPGEISELVMINTSSCGESRFYERIRPQNLLRMAQLFRRRSDLSYREKAILEMTARDLPHLEQQAELQSHLIPTKADNFLRQMLASSQFRFGPQKPNTRLLLLAAQDDHLVNPVCSQRLAERWQTPLVMHPHGDHDLPLVDGPWILDQIEKFVHQKA